MYKYNKLKFMGSYLLIFFIIPVILYYFMYTVTNYNLFEMELIIFYSFLWIILTIFAVTEMLQNIKITKTSIIRESKISSTKINWNDIVSIDYNNLNCHLILITKDKKMYLNPLYNDYRKLYKEIAKIGREKNLKLPKKLCKILDNDPIE